jgi:hypothetical protein
MKMYLLCHFCSITFAHPFQVQLLIVTFSLQFCANIVLLAVAGTVTDSEGKFFKLPSKLPM